MEKQNKALKKIFFFVLLWIVLFSFYKINEENYIKQKQIKENIVNHPEFLPKSDVAKITSFWFKNIRADYFRLQTIQYIWWNAINAEYKKYLYNITDLINDLNPYFEHPYVIAQLLLPDYNYRYENLDEKEQEDYINQAVLVWQKWINNFCDKEKLEKIKNEFDLKKLWTEETYANPCKSYKIPFYLAFIYYFYKDDPINSSYYYKVASANKDSLEWAKVLAAIMQWKWWNREKSIFMFLALAKSVVNQNNEEDKVCREIVDFMEQVNQIDWNILSVLEKTSLQAFWEFVDDQNESVLDKNTCKNYTYKAIREMNLFYLDNANKLYFEKFNKYAKNPKELKDAWFIDFVPRDFQQYKDYGIIYIFNEKTNYFDYEMDSNNN